MNKRKEKPTLDRIPKKPSLPRLKLLDSTVFRAAAASSIILFASYGIGVAVSVQGIEHVADIAYDKKVATTLDGFLQTIKEVHSLRKDLIVENLAKVVDPEIKYAKSHVYLKRPYD